MSYELCTSKSASVLYISFVLSHPLCFIFLSPYLLKLNSFLCVATTVLSVAFLTGTELVLRHFLVAYKSSVDKFQSQNKYEDDRLLENHKTQYEVFFGSIVMEVTDNIVPVQLLEESSGTRIEDLTCNGNVEEKTTTGLDSQSENAWEEEGFIEAVDGFERIVKGKKKDDDFVEKQMDVIEPKVDSLVNNSCKNEQHNGLNRIPIIVHSYGSMRKEKEWERTLACKLMEDRHNADGGEGMDILWEAYEIDSNKQKHTDNDRTKMNNNKNNKKKKKKSFGYEDEEGEDINVGHLCCLQTLKLSAGKMSLGMGKPNLVKISKAIKGIGWLHHVSKKKVHNNNGDKYS